MKKLLYTSILGLAALALGAAPSQARTFGLIPHHCWPCRCFGRCGACCGTICIRPYNAFSPVASGSMCFDGCNPFCGGGPGYCGGPIGATLPACDGAPAPGAPTPAPVPALTPAPNPGPGAQLFPYGQPYSYGGYGR